MHRLWSITLLVTGTPCYYCYCCRYRYLLECWCYYTWHALLTVERKILHISLQLLELHQQGWLCWVWQMIRIKNTLLTGSCMNCVSFTWTCTGCEWECCFFWHVWCLHLLSCWLERKIWLSRISEWSALRMHTYVYLHTYLCIKQLALQTLFVNPFSYHFQFCRFIGQS